MTENNIDQEFEALKKRLADLADVIEEDIKRRIDAGDDAEAAKKKSLKYWQNVEDIRKKLKKTADDIITDISGLKKSFSDGTVNAMELSDGLDKLRDDINKTSDQSRKATLIEQKASLERINAQNKASAIFKDSISNMSGQMGKVIVGAFSSAAKSALSGGDAFEMAGGMMNAGLDLVNTANQGGANALKSFGAATAGAGGKIGLMGAVAGVAGAALGAVSEGLTELAKAGISFMITQTRALLVGFADMSKAGAIYSGGMIAMTQTALKSGMTLEQFSKSVANNTDKLSKLGLGVGEASKRMSGAMAAGGKSARDGMFALGMSMEEQADAYATVMERMAGPNQRLTATNQEVAAATQAYVRDLKILQNITGEDIKAKNDKIRQENDTLAFQQKLAEMDPKKAEALRVAMESMSESQRRALRERMIYNTVISTDLGIAEATNAGIAKNHELTYRAALDGSLNAEKMRDIQQQTAADTAQAAKENKALAMAQSDAAVGASKINLEQWQYQGQFTKEAVAAAEKAAKKQQQSGAAGKDTAANLMELQQQQAIKMQAIA